MTTTCFAQFNSAVEGTVTDPTGAAVANATVTLHNAQTSVDLHDTTKSAGFFRFSDVGPGDYTVTVEALGFPRNSTSVHVIQDQNASVKRRAQGGRHHCPGKRDRCVWPVESR